MTKLGTGASSLDALLNGGIEEASITLLYGEAGSGKTNLCLVLSRNSVLMGKRVLYIDTEGVSAERLKQIAGNQIERVLKGILFSEPYSMEEQTELISKGIALLQSQPFGLFVIDSLTVFCRAVGEDMSERRELSGQINMLLSAARKYRMPVLVTSQVYTDFEKNSFEPLGGHVLQHAAKTIIRLEKKRDGGRRAVLIKHRYLKEMMSADFNITAEGIE